MTDPTELEWHAPGEGHWLRSAGHYARPLPILMTEWHDESMERGFGRGFSLVGAPLRTMSSEAVNGWPYSRLVPLLGKPGQPVSNLRVRLEFALRPSLRRRRRTARQVFHERPWIDQATMWDRTGKARGKATHARLAAVDLEKARNHELADLLLDIRAQLMGAVEDHFRHAPPASVAIGQLLLKTEEWAGVSPDDALLLLAGSSPATAAPRVHLERIVDVLDDEVSLDGDPEEVLGSISDSSVHARRELEIYLAEFGDNPISGYSPLDLTARELPGLLVAGLRAIRGGQAPPNPEDLARRMEAMVRSKLPADKVADWGELLADARVAMAVRDDDSGVKNRLVGRLRRIALEVGSRLAEAGVVDRSDAVFDMTVRELADALEEGSTDAPYAERRAIREAAATADAPATLGEPEALPSLRLMPSVFGDVAKVMAVYSSRVDGRPPSDGLGDQIAGIGIGDGSVTAKARVVRDLDDLLAFEPGEVLVTPMTSPTFNAALTVAVGIVTDVGGAASHAAIMAREFSLPTVVGTGGATQRLSTGDVVTVDAATGTVTVAQA